MTSSLTNNPFERQRCMPCFNCDDISPLMIQAPRNDHGETSKMKQTEDILAAEMWKLSTQELSSALDDLHCVGEEVEETAEMVQQYLAEFEEAVQKDNQNPFYVMATNQNRAYVEDPKFRLKFIRAKMYDVSAAVKQMMSYLQYKATYFGNDKIARDISLDDLQAEDKKLLLSGLFHIQNERDRKGRVIIHMFGKMLSRCRPDTMIRMSHYIHYTILASCPDVQMKGLVAVYNDTTLPGESFVLPGLNFMKETQAFFDSLPIRYSAMHYCVQPIGQNLVMNNTLVSLFLLGLPQYARVRTRIHIGSIIEFQYRLKSYGIPLDSFPFDASGNVMDREALNLWFYKHCKQIGLEDDVGSVISLEPSLHENEEMDTDQLMSQQPLCHSYEATSMRETVRASGQCFNQMGSSKEQEVVQTESLTLKGVNPTDSDVLFGKGYRLQSHPGNARFREFLRKHEVEYESASRPDKHDIAIQLARILRNNGSRFLQKDEFGEWIESDIVLAEKKIAQYFRELRKKRAKGKRGRLRENQQSACRYNCL